MMNKRIQTAVFGLILITALPAVTRAKDQLAMGYSSASGVFAGMWVAQEGRIFEKYDIDSRLVLIASGSLMVQAML
jgi:ABC-type nitrate/sulfonate/bicarbonate transport system substrate-binding protein